jgi:hypothetical protein
VIDTIVFAVTLVVINFSWAYTAHKKDERIEAERQQWAAERQKLMDRVQAPSFDHLKQAEVRIIKAQKEEPPVKYELV